MLAQFPIQHQPHSQCLLMSTSFVTETEYNIIDYLGNMISKTQIAIVDNAVMTRGLHLVCEADHSASTTVFWRLLDLWTGLQIILRINKMRWLWLCIGEGHIQGLLTKCICVRFNHPFLNSFEIQYWHTTNHILKCNILVLVNSI